ncbi:sporadically distributed protein, TIGR04141 family [Thalassotalea euphylliae]|uniref:Sporadically distributed protein, TIGR04141 family n=1 Tax=Thalassotalea euphylliae TaxID=1655234 RepID=A0A3E0TW01_9GAMM|nr:TIGR04141 family sporadically distributed protein [Thalassotalea euphylliae]REL28600.1 sporadically distributed protein, TIGR04141 family [Thalassotalea euphylliae]
MAVKKRSIELSVCLVKSEYADHLDSQLIDTSKCLAPFELDIGDSSTSLYIKKESKSQPGWIEFLASAPGVSAEMLGESLSIGATLIIRVSENTFILSFGQGHFLRNDEIIVREFGLKVVLNSIVADDIRSLDKATGELTSLNARTQSSKGGDIYNLLIDTEMDFLQALSAKVRDEFTDLFGVKISGRDVLKISPKIDIFDLVPTLTACYNQYKKPLPSEFTWVDNIKRVTDKPLIADLKNELVVLLNSSSAKDLAWLGEPEVVDHEQLQGYSFTEKSKELDLFLRLDHLLEVLEKKSGSKPFTIKILENQTIWARMSDGRVLYSWSAYRCINTEIKYKGNTYLLRSGEWFNLASSYQQAVDDALKPIPINKIKLPAYTHNSEGLYNNDAATQIGGHCLDAKNIIHGGRHSKIEFCDLLQVKSHTNLIHVKRYSGSATLSHLFYQAQVSSELLKVDADFRKKLNEKLPAEAKFTDVFATPNTDNYHVVFGIVTKKNLPLDLPFFSKITLKNAHRSLIALGYKVSITVIDIEQNIDVKSIAPIKAKLS